MQIVYSNITRREDQELREKVLLKMKEQIRKKFFEPSGRTKLNIVASHSSTKANSIEQIQNQTV